MVKRYSGILAIMIYISCVTAADRPRLTPAEVISLADAHARAALHRDLREFQRSAPRYSVHQDAWFVVYRNTAGTAPSDVTIQLSDKTRKTQTSFGDISK
jgi:hypothetical protein